MELRRHYELWLLIWRGSPNDIHAWNIAEANLF